MTIQGLFGEQEAFDNTSVDELIDAQRSLLFETVCASGGDVIASDYTQQLHRSLVIGHWCLAVGL